MSGPTLSDARRLLSRQVSPRDPKGPPPRHVRIEQVRMDLAVRSDDGSLVQPWVTLLMDMQTRTIIGADVSVEPATHDSVVRCLKKAVSPRQRSKKRARR